MKFINLASGSKGNSTLIESSKRKILIDQGLSFKEIKSRLSFLKIQPKEITAIFITHEHGDHIKGLGSFLKNCPECFAYIHYPLLQIIRNKFSDISPDRIIGFEDHIELDDLYINSFTVSHDSTDCVGYKVSEGKNKVAVVTDLGYFTPQIVDVISECSLALIEANHDVKLLINNNNYPIKTRARILSGKGHLSNDQSAEFIYMLSQGNLKQVILAHLSEENNTPLLAYNTIISYLSARNVIEGRDIYIDVAKQDRVSSYFLID